MTAITETTPERIVGTRAITKPTASTRAATTPNTIGPFVFDRNSMIRLKE